MWRIFLVLFWLISWNISGQILSDNQAKEWISNGLNHMYNHEFKESTDDFNALKSKYPKHPSSYLLLAMQWEKQYFPLKDHPNQSKAYLAYLERSFELAEAAFEKNENDLEAVFFCISSTGFLAAYEADNQNFMKAVSYTRKSYSFLKIALKNTDKQPEFLYSAGIYNYYRIVYPELHPVIKPLMVFFEEGNKRVGLNFLEQSTRKTIFVKNEGRFYLGYVYNKYEGTPAKALPLNQALLEDFPSNHLFILQRAELLALTHNFEEGEIYLDKLEKLKIPYFTGAAWVFRGIADEFGKRKMAQAEAHYLKALQYPFEERFTKDIRGLAYLGLCRIAHKSGQKAKAKKYLHLSKEYIEYKNSQDEYHRLSKLL